MKFSSIIAEPSALQKCPEFMGIYRFIVVHGPVIDPDKPGDAGQHQDDQETQQVF